LRKKLAILTQNTPNARRKLAKIAKNSHHNIGFQEKRRFFPPKISENRQK
jgi:hypothetical protein